MKIEKLSIKNFFLSALIIFSAFSYIYINTIEIDNHQETALTENVQDQDDIRDVSIYNKLIEIVKHLPAF